MKEQLPSRILAWSFPDSVIISIVGDYALAVETELAVISAINLKRANFMQGDLPFLPDFVGNKFRVSMGPKSGLTAVKWMMEENCLPIRDREVPRLVAEVTSLAGQRKRPLTDQEIDELVKRAAN